MTISDEYIIGKKGEILPKKALREIAGINSGDKVIIEAVPGKFVIRKIYSVDELFNRPSLGKISLNTLNQELKEESDQQEAITINKLQKHMK